MTDTTPSTQLTRDKRKYMTPDEVALFLATARKHGRHRQRDYACILLAYQHGLRVSELCGLLRADVNLKNGTIALTRRKDGVSGLHPLTGEAMRAIRAMMRTDGLPWLFVNERDGQLTRQAVHDTFKRIGKLAGLPRCNPHSLRHACGYKLVNDGTDLRLVQAYLGHKSIASTMIYTPVNTARFRGLF